MQLKQWALEIINSPSRTVEERVFAANCLEKITPLTDTEEMNQALRYVFALIGLRGEHFPDPLETQVLVNFIRSNYTEYTLEEVKLAFTFLVVGRLEFKNSDDAKHFQKFSPEYFGRIMKAYDRYSAEMIASAKRMLNSKDLLEASKPLTEEERIVRGKNEFDFLVRFWKENEALPLCPLGWNEIHAHCESSGLIRDTKSKKEKYFLKVKKELIKETEAKKAAGNLVTIASELKRIERGDIKFECRKRRVIDYLKTLTK